MRRVLEGEIVLVDGEVIAREVLGDGGVFRGRELDGSEDLLGDLGQSEETGSDDGTLELECLDREAGQLRCFLHQNLRVHQQPPVPHCYLHIFLGALGHPVRVQQQMRDIELAPDHQRSVVPVTTATNPIHQQQTNKEEKKKNET